MKRNTEELKEKLIQTGIEEIKEHGIDNLSLRTVAKSCGVTHGSPYRHFESKENYLKVVLKHLSEFLNEELKGELDFNSAAREQLVQMGFNLISFAKKYPYYFEALFIKFPFKYMEITRETISPLSDLPGFSDFKRIVASLRREEGFNNSEAESLLHFWSFISGLAVIANSPVGYELDDNAVLSTIKNLLDIYIRGEKL